MVMIRKELINPIRNVTSCKIDSDEILSFSLNGSTSNVTLSEIYIPDRQEFILDKNVKYEYVYIQYRFNRKYINMYNIRIDKKIYPILIEIDNNPDCVSNFYINISSIKRLIQKNFLLSEFNNILLDILSYGYTYYNTPTDIIMYHIENYLYNISNTILVKLDLFSKVTFLNNINIIYQNENSILDFYKDSIVSVNLHLFTKYKNIDHNGFNNTFISDFNSIKITTILANNIYNKSIKILDNITSSMHYSIKLLFNLPIIDFTISCYLENNKYKFNLEQITYKKNNINQIIYFNDLVIILNVLLSNLQLINKNKNDIIYIKMLNKFELIISINNEILYIPIFLYSLLSLPIIFSK